MNRIKSMYNNLPSLYKLLVGIVIIIIGLSMSSSAVPVLTGSNSSPHKIFKCQPSTLNATIPGFVGGVWVNLTPTNGFPTESFLMVNTGGDNFAYTYGNDPTLNWGNKTLSFYNDGVELPTTNYVFVYSDSCTGTNIGSYRNVSYRNYGFGNYTRALFSGQRNLIEFAQQPYLDYFGFSIYLLMLFTMCVVVYVKNQSIMQPLMLAFLGLTTLALSSLVPTQFKTYILLLMAVATAAIFYRLFKSA